MEEIQIGNLIFYQLIETGKIFDISPPKNTIKNQFKDWNSFLNTS